MPLNSVTHCAAGIIVLSLPHRYDQKLSSDNPVTHTGRLRSRSITIRLCLGRRPSKRVGATFGHRWCRCVRAFEDNVAFYYYNSSPYYKEGFLNDE